MSIKKPQKKPSGSKKDQAQPLTIRTALSDRIRLSHPNKLQPGETVAVAISGGVDSMVAARLLKERGHQVVALHMILLLDDRPEPSEHIRKLAARLDVPLHAVDLRLPFHELVIKPFLTGYRQGKTVNPCVICNPTIKFKLLREQAVRLGAKILATGHYARLRFSDSDERVRLFRARDRRKDQSYFLYGLTQPQLAQAFFPLGDFLKSEVRQLAADTGMSDWHRPESQEICFISDEDYRNFMEKHLGPALPEPGPVLDLEGRQVGEHQGIHRYTIGQRRGLGIPSSAPYYVVGLEPETNTVRVGRESDLNKVEMLVTDVNWIAAPPTTDKLEALVQVRSRHQEAPALLKHTGQGIIVRFNEPQMAITPGQSAVFYSDDEVIGGGIIERVIS